MPNMISESNTSIKVTRVRTDNVLGLIQPIENKKRLLVLERITKLKFSFTHRKDHLVVSRHTRPPTIVDI